MPLCVAAYFWSSVIIIPSYSFDLVEFSRAPVFVDFGRMLHPDGESNIMEVLVNTQLVNHNVCVCYGLLAENESSRHWDIVRHVSFGFFFLVL
jgi:hypothetical protein